MNALLAIFYWEAIVIKDVVVIWSKKQK
jgi:hypothetical protein